MQKKIQRIGITKYFIKNPRLKDVMCGKENTHDNLKRFKCVSLAFKKASLSNTIEFKNYFNQSSIFLGIKSS